MIKIHGFALIEALIAIAILGIVASLDDIVRGRNGRFIGLAINNPAAS